MIGRGRWLIVSRRVAVVLMMLLGQACSRTTPLETIVRGGAGPPTLVLLHGYGSSAEQWLPFTQTIRWPARGRFVFPQAPAAGPAGGRAWWPLDLYDHIAPGTGLPDLSATSPEGLPVAATRVAALLTTIRSEVGGPVVLGGFSQGAMVASEIAFRSAIPLDALVLFSPTTVSEPAWANGYASRRALPIFMAHGRRDRVLSFAIADRWRRGLQDAGLMVTWHAFDGEHELPAEVVEALNEFLSRGGWEQ